MHVYYINLDGEESMGEILDGGGRWMILRDIHTGEEVSTWEIKGHHVQYLPEEG